jgi:adenylate cyclase
LSHGTHTSAAAGDGHDVKERQQIDLLLQFFTSTKNYCVGVVDMVNSTAITMKMPHDKAGRYYSIFLNSLAEVVTRFGAVVVKNAGDSLLYYFPKTEQGDEESFRDVLRCCFAMAAAAPRLNAQMEKEDLPEVRYRISCEYGAVMVAKMSTSSVNDIFGTSVNLCSKMNVLARPGGIVIGEGLYGRVKSFSEYKFEEMRDAPLFADNDYRVYSVDIR